MGTTRVELFVVAHTDATLSTVPEASAITPVDLRTLSLDASYDDRFAESRFLLSPEARGSDADVIGLFSANYDLKWPDPPHLIDIARLGRRLPPSQALGEELLHLDDWMKSAEYHHPGMADILHRLADEFGLEPRTHRVPGCNTFVCHREHYVALLDTFATLLNAALDWYGTDVPFRYRCPDCGTVSDTGFGRWTNQRHIGYFGERITRLIFASRPDIEFWTPAQFEESSRFGALAARARRKGRARRGDRGAVSGADATPWHASAHGLDDAKAAGFTMCPVCAETAHA